MDPATGVMTYDRLHTTESCVQKQFKNFDQDPTLVKVIRVTDPDTLRLHTTSGTTILAHAECNNMEETRRRLRSDPMFA